MTQSVLQIASDIVEACPYTAKMKSAHKLLLAAMISEELSKQRQDGYEAGRKSVMGELGVSVKRGTNNFIVVEKHGET